MPSYADTSSLTQGLYSWQQPEVVATPASNATSTTTFPGTTAATTGAIASGTQVYSQLPGYQDSIANIGNAIKSESAGEVPQDVIQQLQQQGAEGNAVSGAASNAAYLKALGLTSLGLQDNAVKNLESVLPNLPGAGISQNSAYYQTQAQAYEAQLQQEVFQRQQQQQQLAFQQQEAALQAAKSSTGANAWGTQPGYTSWTRNSAVNL